MLARFPFYADEEKRCEEVADELRDLISRSHQPPLAHNGFWETFCDDVSIGAALVSYSPSPHGVRDARDGRVHGKDKPRRADGGWRIPADSTPLLPDGAHAPLA